MEDPLLEIQPNASQYVGKGDENDEEEDPYAGLYEDVPQTVWREKAGEEDDWDEPLF